MIPKTLSASSLQVAGLCMERWAREYLDKAPGFSGVAANIGSACHRGLELYVQHVYIDKDKEATWEVLKGFYEIGYIEVFQNANFDSDEFKDGLAMVQSWHKRTSFDDVERVVSVEFKKQMPLPVRLPSGEEHRIPFSYIIDRLDYMGNGEYRVVDYKTVRVPIQPEELFNKVQALTYGLSVLRDYEDATKIRVVFDLLRHEPVGIVVTAEQCVAFAHYLMAEAQRIVDTDRDDVLPTLNMECGYCVFAPKCPALQKNVDAGSILSLSIEEVAELKMEVDARNRANKVISEQIDDRLLRHAYETDELEWETDSIKVELGLSRRRKVQDVSKVAAILGPERFAELGNITLGNLDTILKDPSLDEGKKAAIKSLIGFTTGDPKPKVTRKKTLI